MLVLLEKASSSIREQLLIILLLESVPLLLATIASNKLEMSLLCSLVAHHLMFNSLLSCVNKSKLWDLSIRLTALERP